MPGEQLALPIEGLGLTERLPARIPMMQPSPGIAPFDDEAFLFEPWWPGVRASAWIERHQLTRLDAAGMADALGSFPELVEELPGCLLDDGTVLDGWLLVLDDGGWLDAELLRRRLGGDRAAGRPAFVASDLLWSAGTSWLRRSFAARRRRLTDVLTDGDRCVVSRAYRGDGTLLAEALGRFGIDGISARRLDARHRAGPAGDAWLRLPVTPAASIERPQLALIQRLPLAG